MAVTARTVEQTTKEQPMFPTAHPEIMRQLASDRAADLRADAARYRTSRRFPPRWRPARFPEPAADLSRVVPVPEVGSARPGRAA